MKIIYLNLFLMLSTLSALVSQEISSDFPFESNYLSIDNAKIHYIDVGRGDPILFLHGIPMSSYSWRNIIPGLSDQSRCLALDFMGFGKSDKPDIDYNFENYIQHLTTFIDQLDLQNITLVMTDIGGVIGANYAINHPERIKGLVFMETPIGDAETFHKNGGFMQRMMFWMGGKDKMGYNMIVKKNMFIKMMPMLIKRKLSKTEKSNYSAPFPTKESRLPLFTLPNAFPRKGKDVKEGDMGYYLNLNAEGLKKIDKPKLILHANPGMLINKKALKWIGENFDNYTTVDVGKAKHLMEEDLPFEVSNAIQTWMSSQE